MKISLSFLNNLLKNKRLLIKEYKLGIVISVSTILIFIMVVSLVIHLDNQAVDEANSQGHEISLILSQVNDLSSQLEQLMTTPADSKSFETALQNIQADIHTIQTSSAKSGDIDKVLQQISTMKDDVDTQIISLKKELAGSDDDKDYLDASLLPFKVVSIDVISQQPYVSIDYQHHLTPLAIGDAIAGWRLTDADYANAAAEFENDKSQYIKVTLQDLVGSDLS